MSLFISFLIAFLMSYGPLGCKSSQDSRAKAFDSLSSPTDGTQKVLEKQIQASEFKVQGLIELGIPYTAHRVFGAANSFFTDVRFGPITEDQYTKLVKRYGGMTKVPFQAQRQQWRLLDFMPPIIQALDGHRFVLQQVDVPAWIPLSYISANRLDPFLRMETNCFATAYEVARSILVKQDSLQFTSFFLGNVSLDSFFWNKYNPAISPSTDKSWFEETAAEKRNMGRQFGDVVLVTNVDLLHGAVWIDKDLYFEKTDSDSNAPYRLSTFTDMIDNPALSEVLQNGSPQLKFIRFIPERMESPAQFFGGFSFHPMLAEGKLFPGETFKEAIGVDNPEASRLYMAMFSKQAGGNGGSLNFLKTFNLQLKPSSNRFELPQEAYTDKTFIP